MPVVTLAALPLAASLPLGALAVLLACGVYDVSRNRPHDAAVLRRYFTGNGILTWLLSPLNTLLDLMSLPYVNKGIYTIDDLPKGHQEEIRRLIDAAHSEDLVGKLEARAEKAKRSMVFFKWYGANVETFADIPAFHEKYRYIKTIGVSCFNKRQSTSKHFGPLRATLRVLYNVNDIRDDTAYIDVGDVRNVWRDSKLFIFDDTLMHRSVNETDQARYCLFVDILRPSLLTGPMSAAVSATRVLLRGVNYLFYKNWEVIQK